MIFHDNEKLKPTLHSTTQQSGRDATFAECQKPWGKALTTHCLGCNINPHLPLANGCQALHPSQAAQTHPPLRKRRLDASQNTLSRSLASPPAQSKSFHTWNSSRILSSNYSGGDTGWWGCCSHAPNHSVGLVLEEGRLAWCRSFLLRSLISFFQRLSKCSWNPSWTPAISSSKDSTWFFASAIWPFSSKAIWVGLPNRWLPEFTGRGLQGPPVRKL